jgi:hypothetical protein
MLTQRLKLWPILLFGSLFLLTGVLTGCAPDTSAPELQPRQTEVALASDPVEDGGADALVSDDAGALAADIPPFVDFACLECHTDQARLLELAVEEEETESLSEGPG